MVGVGVRADRETGQLVVGVACGIVEVPCKIIPRLPVGDVLQAEDIAHVVVGVVSGVRIGGGGVFGAGVQVPRRCRYRAGALAARGGDQTAQGVVDEGAVQVAGAAGSIVRGGLVPLAYHAAHQVVGVRPIETDAAFGAVVRAALR